jgi:hypothetical protein
MDQYAVLRYCCPYFGEAVVTMSWLCQTLTMRILVVSEEYDANTLLEAGSMKSIFRQAIVGSY